MRLVPMTGGRWFRVCTSGDGVPGSSGVPGSIGEALGMLEASLDYLNGPGGRSVEPAALGQALQALARAGSKYSAAWNSFLSRFDANGCHDTDGYQTSAAWLAGKTGTDLTAARGQVRQMRQVTARPVLDAAMADGTLTESLAARIIAWTRQLPAEMHDEADKILLTAAAAGADPGDLRLLAASAIEQWKSTRPDPDDLGDLGDGFADRRLVLEETFGGAGRLSGDLTPECSAAVRAVCEALGKKRGKEDTRGEGQRFHDALQEGCELLIRAKLVPDRAGSDTRVDAVISLAELRGMDGASAIEDAWLLGAKAGVLGAKAGLPGYLAGKDAEAISCDALIVPVVTGCCDWGIIGQMIELVLDAFADSGPAQGAAGRTARSSSGGGTGNGEGQPGPGNDDGQPGAGNDVMGFDARGRHGEATAKALPPEAWEALLYAVAKLAIGFVSGPGGLASALRRGLLEHPYNGRSIPIDVGWSETIPESVRRAVRLRDRHCRWPGGCGRPPAVCDVHHVKHKKDGGPTSVQSCLLLCQYHHDICVHRWGWKLELLPDGEVTATGPHGQVLRSRPPPGTGPLENPAA